MPIVNIHNRTKSSTLPKGVGCVIRAGATDSKGVFKGKPNKMEVKVDKFVCYDIPSSAFRITSEPKDKKIKPVNWVQQKGMLKKNTDLYIIALTEDDDCHLDISFEDPAI
jgi:hypothetical protein